MDINSFIQKNSITDRDVQHITKHGKSVERLIENYDIIQKTLAKERGYVHCQTPLVENDVVRLSSRELAEGERIFDEEKTIPVPAQFIPASGYASRMFGYLECYLQATMISEQENAKIIATIKGLDRRITGPKFAFIDSLENSLQSKGESLDRLIDGSLCGGKNSTDRIIKEILYEEGLGYKSFPKALLPFHHNGKEPVIALKEHIADVWRSGKSKLSLAISPHHEQLFHQVISSIMTGHPHLRDVRIDVSFQHPETDSIAINPDTGEIIRDTSGSILFFPAGHGSLLANIHETCYIRNIDNLPFGEERRKLLASYHKAMFIKLTSIKKVIGSIINGIDNGSMTPQTLREKYEVLAGMKFNLFLDTKKYAEADFPTQKTMIRTALDRPVCISGLVKNAGEPGGGPFFYKIGDIVTSSIIERDEIAPDHLEVMKRGEFFNPVEILFDPTDHNGNLFNDLTQFEDRNRYIFVKKLFNGKPTIRMEYPGLWNGRMAKCNKVWILLPPDIFAPVKELIDLLSEKHQRER